MTQAVSILVTKTRDGRYRARFMWTGKDGAQRRTTLTSRGMLDGVNPITRFVLALMNGDGT